MDIIKLPDNNGKLSIYTGGNIRGIYIYLENIWAPNDLTTLGQWYKYFDTSYCTNNDTATLHRVIWYLYVLYKFIWWCCGIIGHKDDVCIIHGHKLLPSSLRRNMNKLNTLHGDKPNESPRGWNIQPLAVQLIFRNYTPNNSTVFWLSWVYLIIKLLIMVM